MWITLLVYSNFVLIYTLILFIQKHNDMINQTLRITRTDMVSVFNNVEKPTFVNLVTNTIVRMNKKGNPYHDQVIKNLSFSPGPLHRLDRNTQGLITFSVSLKGARSFTAMLKNSEIDKCYLTIVDGSFNKRVIDIFLTGGSSSIFILQSICQS